MEELTEAEVCMRRVNRVLAEQEWDLDCVRREYPITEGTIVPYGRTGRRNRPLRADYVLCLKPNAMIAVIEAKSTKKLPDDGLQQAMRYATMLEIPFAYSTNGEQIYEYDFTTKKQRLVTTFPTPDELKARLQQYRGMSDSDMEILLKPFDRQLFNNQKKVMEPRYYQEIAVNKIITAILENKKRLLLTMATGTGKTFVAFQIAYRLWNSKSPKPKILFLTDRDVLLRQAMNGAFNPFGKARHRIQRNANTAYDMYFALYQALDSGQSDEHEGEDESNMLRVYRQYKPDFFDYIIIDECHRGSSTEGGNWRNILDYFGAAVHIGMTATPKEKNDVGSKDTYDYFGSPVYEYSLKQGIMDGFLAPYRIYKFELSGDQEGYNPAPGETDLNGRALEDRQYELKDFDRVLAINSRRKLVAKHLIDFMRQHESTYDKTILFCQDSEHALAMTKYLRMYSEENPNYAVRIVSDEGEIGRVHLEHFKTPTKDHPVIAVTSKLLSTGVDVPTCKIIALDKNINSLTEFKQIIGRGTRVLETHNKMWFKIVDYRNATTLFNDPNWNGDPDKPPHVEPIPENWTPTHTRPTRSRGSPQRVKKYYVDGHHVEIEGVSVRIFDETADRPRLLSYTDYTAEKVRKLTNNPSALTQIWADTKKRQWFITELQKVGITFEHLKEITDMHAVDPLDMLLHYAFDAKQKTRRQRVNHLRQKPFLARYPNAAKAILEVMLDHYAENGYQELEGRGALELPQFAKFGTPTEIINAFGDGEKFDAAMQQLVEELYMTN